MKIRVVFILILVFLSSVFAWWLYSFIQYTQKEYTLQKDNLQLHAIAIENKLAQFIEKHSEPTDSNVYETYKANQLHILNYLEQLNQQHQVKTQIVLIDAQANSHEFIKIELDPSELENIHKRFEKKQRAFYSEVIFLAVLIIGGVVWVFQRLQALLNLNTMQNNFLLSVTHELKTPLTAIKLSAQTLKRKDLPEAVHAELNKQIESNADRLNELLDNVLVATRIDGNQYHVNLSELDLTELIHSVADLILTTSQFKGQFEFNESAKMIKADEVALKMVFSNLFQNAIKYAGDQATIHVSYRSSNKGFDVIVADNGPGIDESELKAIFNKFYRVGNESVRSTKGTGLGLYLVQQILKSHKAEIQAANNTPQGTQFIITFK